MPERIQLRRTKGWRKPEGAIVVARPSRWGNPYRVIGGSVILAKRLNVGEYVLVSSHAPASRAVDHMLELYRMSLFPHGQMRDLTALAGHDLACWCALDAPCHADVLLELANA